MAPRQARSSLVPSQPKKAHKKNHKRSLNALSVATSQLARGSRPAHKDPGVLSRPQSHPLARTKKRGRGDADEGLENGAVVYGSDSDGNEWRLGEVGSQEDSELDSDYALGASDEERFEGFVFGGSSGKKRTTVKDDASKLRSRHSKTSEADPGEGGDDEELGEVPNVGSEQDEDGVEILDLLDASGSSEEDDPAPPTSHPEVSEDEPDDEGSEDEVQSLLSVSEDIDRNDPAKIDALQAIIQSMHSEPADHPSKRQRLSVVDVSGAPSEFGMTATRKLTIDDLLPSVTDADMRKSLRLLTSGKTQKDSRKRSGIPGKLDPPLAKRQQAKLDRAAAYGKSRETLERWIDTIKHNRRAEHLAFPLVEHNSVSAQQRNRTMPRERTLITSELEATIQNILQESGLVTGDGKTEEHNLKKLEETRAKELSLQTLQFRRAELRLTRDLLFREEMRARRIKKIKSKSYRRVHRKEREKAEQGTKAALAAGGFIDSDEEQALHHKKRAEERMGARHREGRWAKQAKAGGRQKWDLDARAGIQDMANTEEVLKRKIEGKSTKPTDDSEFTSSSEDESGSDITDDGSGATGDRKLLRQLDELSGPGKQHPQGYSKLASLKFMQKSEAARKLENDKMVEDLKRGLAGEEEEDSSHDEPVNIGRRKYQPSLGLVSAAPLLKGESNEFEEREEQANDLDNQEAAANPEDDEPLLTMAHHAMRSDEKQPLTGKLMSRNPSKKHARGAAPQAKLVHAGTKSAIATSHPIKAPHQSKSTSNHRTDERGEFPISDPQKTPPSLDPLPPSDVAGWKSLFLETVDSASGIGDLKLNIEPPHPVVASLDQDELRKMAFAGDDVDQNFQAEKEAMGEAEDNKIIDNTLPGWGYWVGDGISKKQQARQKGKYLTIIKGVERDKRKDAKLEHVIISEKRIKKNSKYQATMLPHPFESREQYERSLRIPVGPEWTTKETFQAATKPRILLKQGIITPMLNPFI